jgi:tripartite ATP-independent transporter DctP family solute receptor
VLLFSVTAIAEPITLQIGFENSMSEPIGQALAKWQELVAAQGDGSLVIELFPDSQLGNKTDLIDQMLLGEPVMTLADGAFFADYGVPDMGIVFGPFLFENWDQCWTLIESDWWNEQCAQLEALGLKMVAANWAYGARHTLTTKQVKTPADLAGLQIRVPTNQIQTKGFEYLGATPVGMSLGDVYTALQQGTIDGLENPLTVLYNGAYQEVCKYLILDHHILDYTCWVMGTDFFNTLTPEQQQILIEAGNEAGVYNNAMLEETTNKALEDLKAAGVEVVDFDRDSFVAASESFYADPEIQTMWSEGLIDQIKEIIK